MAGESIVQVTEGSGKKLHTYQRTIGANAVEDELVIPGEHYLASYIASYGAISAANAGDDVAQLMAGASLNVRVRRIRVEAVTLIAAAGLCLFQVYRLTSAGTGGAAVTPSKFDNNDGAAGATAAGGIPTATKGTKGALMLYRAIQPTQTAATAGAGESFWEWTANPGMKPLIIPAGATNGIGISNVAAHAGLQVAIEIEFTETSFL